jgi:hypothetical protein
MLTGEWQGRTLSVKGDGVGMSAEEPTAKHRAGRRDRRGARQALASPDRRSRCKSRRRDHAFQHEISK